MLWLLLGLLTLAIVALLLWPLLRRTGTGRARHEYDLEVYKDQLAEIDRDVARGLLDGDHARAAKLEVQRRILTAGAGVGQERTLGRPVLIAILLGLVLPVAALALYGRLGMPGLPDQPFLERMIAHMGLPRDKATEMIGLVEKLEANMQAHPSDPQGWRMLGRSYNALGRPDAAADAFKAAIEHGATDAETQAALGEALVLATGGVIGPEAKQAFEAALATDPTEPRARFYLALARAQAGDARGAIALWRGLAQEANPDAPFLPTLRSRIAELAASAGIDPETVPPETAPSSVSAPPQGGGLAGIRPEERQMVEGMVAGLAAKLEANPEDFEGWKRLGRSYAVLGRLEEAKKAWQKAAALRPRDLSAKLGLAETLVAALPDQQARLPADLAGLMHEIVTLDPDQPDALYYLGQDEALAGRPDEARAHWQRLLKQLPEGSPARREVEERLRSLPGR